MKNVKVAIIGSGPGGLSAAAHAAELGVSHVMFERTALHANTIQEYQVGKRVLAEPGYLPLRSPMPFQEDSREDVLEKWRQALSDYNVNIRYNAEITQITKEREGFTVKLNDGEVVESEFVILSIGVAGNPRKLPGPGADLPYVQYTLKDPKEFNNETIVVIGAGDAAIENALALAKGNNVSLVNRKAEFARAKEANLKAVLSAIDEKRISCYYLTTFARLEETTGDEKPCLLVLKTEDNTEIKVPCDRVIARLGAIPPRKFLEACGITFSNKNPAALPQLTSTYETNVKGLYAIGALGGYPLIKQAMNQGYETVEYILGNDIRPADHELVVARLASLPYRLEVEDCLSLLRERIPFFAQINPLLFREMMLESTVRILKAGEKAFSKGDFSTSVFTILDGEINLDYESEAVPPNRVRSGEFFGELSLISGRQRDNTATASDYTILIETPRRTLLKLAASIESVREGLDQQFIANTVQNILTPALKVEDLREVTRDASLGRYRAGVYIFREGDKEDTIHLVRRGTIVLSRNVGGREIQLRQVRAGEYFGEVSLMNIEKRASTARAILSSETIQLSRSSFFQLIEKDKTLLSRFQAKLSERASEDALIASSPVASDALDFLLKNGAGEATNMFVIDDSLCVACDNCEVACAETHEGVSRVNRKEGPAFGSVHIALSCRHCENPSCMKDCPPDAIHLEKGGEVNINYDVCIGCGNCVTNCPYGVIRMAVKKPKPTHLFSWLLTGFGKAPGELNVLKNEGIKKAVKCDLCKDRSSGPACVNSCPTGAARRVEIDAFNQLAREVRT